MAEYKLNTGVDSNEWELKEGCEYRNGNIDYLILLFSPTHTSAPVPCAHKTWLKHLPLFPMPFQSPLFFKAHLLHLWMKPLLTFSAILIPDISNFKQCLLPSIYISELIIFYNIFWSSQIVPISENILWLTSLRNKYPSSVFSEWKAIVSFFLCFLVALIALHCNNPVSSLRDQTMPFSSLYPHHLAEYPAQNRCSLNVCWMSIPFPDSHSHKDEQGQKGCQIKNKSRFN